MFLLLGFIWGFGFFVLEVVDPSALSEDGRPIYHDIGGMLEALSASLYMSFMTITGLGYGDIVPTTQSGRTLAVLEAILGQIFLVVMIARFVGLNVAHSIRAAEKRTIQKVEQKTIETVEQREEHDGSPPEREERDGRSSKRRSGG